MCMSFLRIISVFFIMLMAGGCVTEFIPEVTEDRDLLVVEGLLTDQPVANRVRLYLSMSIGDSLYAIPVHGAQVFIKDDLGGLHDLREKEPGCYYTNPILFRGIPGRKYLLLADTYKGSYASPFIEMKPVPPIDSVYYRKIFIKTNELGQTIEGCQIYLDTHDSTNNTRFFRWNYTETWEFRIPYNVPNNTCWITEQSNEVFLTNTSYLSESSVRQFPLKKIGTEKDDRLKVKYSIIVNQYSLSEEEYYYWEKIQKIFQQSGGLYDIIPMTVQGNISCIENPEEQVLGYFSVSSVASQRIFIDDYFSGFKDVYSGCPYATVPINQVIRYLGIYYWIIIWNYDEGTKTYTDQYRCYDCTTRGTIEKPDFWPD
jgi:hypothetical protein